MGLESSRDKLSLSDERHLSEPNERDPSVASTAGVNKLAEVQVVRDQESFPLYGERKNLVVADAG